MNSEKETDRAATSIMVFGPDRSGKTSLIQRLLYDNFPKHPLSTTQLESFNHFFAIGSNNLGKPYDTKMVGCGELPDAYLSTEHFSTFGHFLLRTADIILIVIGSKNLPSADKLKHYIAIGMESNCSSIYWVINKIDQLDIEESNKEQQSIKKYLEEANMSASELNIHFISTKLNHNIQALRESINIPGVA